MALKILNYSTLESIRVHVYLSFIFMIILLLYVVSLLFLFKRINIIKRNKVKYVLTSIIGFIVSFNIYYWQMYLLK